MRRWQSTVPKIRLGGAFKISSANELLSAADTCIPQGLGVFRIMASYFHLLQPGGEISAFAEDFAHPYKNLGIPTAQSRFAPIAISPPDGPPHVATLRTKPFGSARAPVNWRRGANFTQFVLGRLFRTCVFVYVGDVFVAEPLAAADSARDACAVLWPLLGFGPSPGKSHGPAPPIGLLGADVAHDTDHVRACLPSRRKGDHSNDIREILSYSQLNPGQAAKVRACLGFSQSLLFGEVGRARRYRLPSGSIRDSREAPPANAGVSGCVEMAVVCD